MDLKGTRTEQNLKAAFTGESMARNKYLFFAEKAKKENLPDIAELFERMAQNEGIHGKMLYQRWKGIGTSSANLQDAIEGEYAEWSNMYPEFAKIAREEGFDDVGVLFDNIAKIEKDHEYRFLIALTQLSKGNKKVDTESQPETTETTETAETVTVKGYRCVFCGATFETRPDVCSVCEAIGSFEETTIQKPKA